VAHGPWLVALGCWKSAIRNPKSAISSPRDNLPHFFFPQKRELLPKINEMTRDNF
jgi:hypothetical protein